MLFFIKRLLFVTTNIYDFYPLTTTFEASLVCSNTCGMNLFPCSHPTNITHTFSMPPLHMVRLVQYIVLLPSYLSIISFFLSYSSNYSFSALRSNLSQKKMFHDFSCFFLYEPGLLRSGPLGRVHRILSMRYCKFATIDHSFNNVKIQYP